MLGSVTNVVNEKPTGHFCSPRAVLVAGIVSSACVFAIAITELTSGCWVLISCTAGQPWHQQANAKPAAICCDPTGQVNVPVSAAWHGGHQWHHWENTAPRQPHERGLAPMPAWVSSSLFLLCFLLFSGANDVLFLIQDSLGSKEENPSWVSLNQKEGIKCMCSRYQFRSHGFKVAVLLLQ